MEQSESDKIHNIPDGEIPEANEDKELEISKEEREFAIHVKETVEGWIYDPVEIRKYGLSSEPNRVEWAINGWYSFWSTCDVDNPNILESSLDNRDNNEKEITEWFRDYKIFMTLTGDLLSEEEHQRLRERIPNYDDLDYRPGRPREEWILTEKRILEALNDIKRQQWEEFQRLKPEMPRFNKIALKWSELEKAKEAKNLGLSVPDYEFMLEAERNLLIQCNTEYPKDYKEEPGRELELPALWYEFVRRKMGFDITTNKFYGNTADKERIQIHEKQQEMELSNYTEEKIEQMIKSSMSKEITHESLGHKSKVAASEAYRVNSHLMEEIKACGEKYKALRGIIGNIRISIFNNYPIELELRGMTLNTRHMLAEIRRKELEERSLKKDN